MRNSIKMWQNDYSVIYETLKEAYSISDDYFGNLCKPIAKKLKRYDIFGVDRANGVICGNTILYYFLFCVRLILSFVAWILGYGKKYRQRCVLHIA